jgi:hypothetical protein
MKLLTREEMSVENKANQWGLKVTLLIVFQTVKLSIFPMMRLRSKVYYISWSAEDSTRLIAYRLSFRYQPIFLSKAWKLSNRSTNSRLWKVSNFIIFLRNTAHSIVEIPNSLSDRSTLSHDEPILSLPSRLLNRTLEKDFLNRTEQQF